MDPKNQLSVESSQLKSDSIVTDPFAMPPYWHEDGDIILLVEDDNNTKHRFRVHRPTLCWHSPVFRDMFSLGENVVKDEAIPTVPVKGDSVEDVRELLNIIYKGFELYCEPESISFEGALAVLRLSHKYQMEKFKSSIVKLLRRSWPLNSTEYNRVIVSLSAAQKESRISRSIRLINAARLTECYELLPSAFFELSSSNRTTWTSKIGDAEFLCPEDLLRMIKGQALWMGRLKTLENAGLFIEHRAYVWAASQNPGEQLSVFQTRSQFAACSYKTARNENVDYCLVAFRCLKSLVGRKVLDGDSLVDACKSWTSQTFRDEGACPGCAEWMDSLIRDKEIEIWENVTNDFDLPEGVNKDEYTKTSSSSFF